MIDISEQAGSLRLRSGDQIGRAEGAGSSLMTDMPSARPFPLEFSNSIKGVSKSMPFDRLWIGDRAFGRDAAPPAEASPPQEIAALIGRYRTPNPWFGSFDMVTRGNRLVALGLGPLVREAAGYWRAEEDKGGFERFWFDTPVAGRPYRLIWSGAELHRLA